MQCFGRLMVVEARAFWIPMLSARAEVLFKLGMLWKAVLRRNVCIDTEIDI